MSTTTLVASPHPRRPDRAAFGNVPRAFRLRRPPALEPPFDDERDTADVLITGSAPTIEPGMCPPHGPSAGGRAARSILSAPSGEAALAASRYVQVCLEVLNGFRPASHLRTLSGPVEFADVLRHLRLRRNGRFRAGAPHHPVNAAAADPSSPGTTTGGASLREGSDARRGHGRSGGATSPHSGSGAASARPAGVGISRAPANAAFTAGNAARTHTGPGMPAPNQAPHAAFRLLRIVVSEPGPDRAEVVAVIAHGDTSLALAMRLELRRTTWMCTVFQVV